MMYRQQQHPTDRQQEQAAQQKHHAIEDENEPENVSDKEEEQKESQAETEQTKLLGFKQAKNRNYARNQQEESQKLVQTARSEKPPSTPALEVQVLDRAALDRQENAMTHQANLMYDLLHIEIEKIRRKAIIQIHTKFQQPQYS